MYDIKQYVVDGRVEREKIAMDIKYQTLKKEDILSLANNQAVKSAFIGSHYDDRRPKSDWNKNYLDELSYAVVSESFNMDYLLYLNDVAGYVNRKKSNNKALMWTVIFVAAIVVLVMFLVK